MRLINTTTLQMKEFGAGSDLPQYAILSHVWAGEEEEVSYSDMQDPDSARIKPQWHKISQGSRLAKDVGLNWLWIDVPCIDKSSSAELSEAINSMYTWYAHASICLAYLQDVESAEDPAAENSSFRNSRWFKRGWTLQELIAPRKVILLDKNWDTIGTRAELAPIIEEVTKIDAAVLRSDDISTVFKKSIAERMSWASGRETTRPEDKAYSLMGLFGVHMPVIYGEGCDNAFRRLQLEIIQQRHAQRYNLFARNPRPGATKDRPEPSATLMGRRRHALPTYSALEHRVAIMAAIKASRRSLRCAR